MEGAHKTPLYEGPEVTFIVFSKDRPFQLSEYLRTLYTYSVGARVRVHCLCRIEPEHEQGYASLAQAFPQVSIVREKDFADQLLSLIASAHPKLAFGVDDALFCAPLPLDCACNALDTHSDLSCVHLRLSPGVTYCHPAQKVQRQPKLTPLGPSGELCTFRPHQGELDWDYPFDLCGTLYRTRDVVRLLGLLEREAISHPNRLESEGNKVFSKAWDTRQVGETLLRGEHSGRDTAGDDGGGGGERESKDELRACLARRAMVVVTINRVQNVYVNPIYGGASLKEVNELLMLGRRLDEREYLHMNPSSVHVGGVRLIRVDRAAGLPPQRPRVSFVLPVHNGVRHLAQALESIRAQDSPEWECVCVDDASTDGCAALLREVSQKDARFRMCVLSHKVGVAKALDIGLSMARGDLIARMDSDDICLPCRLSSQVAYMCAHACVGVLGTSVEVFYDDSHKKPWVVAHPTSEAEVRWSLPLFCCVAHPSVMMRRDVVHKAGGYAAGNAPHAEDYALWARIALVPQSCRRAESRGIANLGDVLLRLRKHSHNVSTMHASVQQKSGRDAVCAALSRLLGWQVSDKALLVLQRPALATCCADLQAAMDLLDAWKTWFLQDLEGSEDCEACRAFVQQDASNRASELATLAITRFSDDALSMVLWRKWLSAGQSSGGGDHAGLRMLIGAMRR